MISNGKAGRPKKYDYEGVLKPAIIEIAKVIKMGQITPTILAANSDIPYWVWRDREEVERVLENINKKRSTVANISKAAKEFPNLAGKINDIYADKEKVLRVANDYMIMVHQLMENIEALERKNAKYEALEEDYMKIKAELKQSRENESAYKYKADTIFIQSTVRRNLKELGIKENLADIESHKEEAGKIGNKIIDLFDI